MTPIFQVPIRVLDATRSFLGPVPAWLRVVAFVAFVGWLLTAVAVMGGCANLERQAEVHEQVADKAEQAVGVIGQVGGTAEEALAWVRHPINQATIGLLPEPWPTRINAAADRGEDLRPIFDEAAVAAGTFAAQQREIASDLRVKHAENNGKVLNILDSGLAIVLSVLGVGGLSSVITRRIFRRLDTESGMAEGARQVAEVVNQGLYADPQVFRTAVTSGVAGEAMREQLLKSDPIVAATVKATKL